MEKLSQAKIEKDIRHSKNLAGYTGYWHGIFYLLGVAKPKALTLDNKNCLIKAYGFNHKNVYRRK